MNAKTTPEVKPSNAKAWVGLVGTFFTLVAPALLQASTSLDAPWPAVIGAVFAVATALGIYQAPYRPADAVLVPDSPAVRDAVISDESGYTNPWQ